MTERIWERFLTEKDKTVFGRSGYGMGGGFGKRPAVLVIDMTYDFVGDRPEPILESIERWPTLPARTAGPRFPSPDPSSPEQGRRTYLFPTPGLASDRLGLGKLDWKNSRTGEWMREPTDNFDSNRIVGELAPGARKIVIPKHKTSAFFGTPSLPMLTQLGADSVIVTGCTTSGCVRASVVDAFSHNLRVGVVEEGCFDWAEADRAMALCDLSANYANAVPVSQILAHMDTQGWSALPGTSGEDR